MRKCAIIVAGGSGSRMGTAVPKQFLLLDGRPLLQITVEKFLEAFPDIEVIVVLPSPYMEAGKEILQNVANSIKTIAGGETRFHSVEKGLSLVQDDCIVFVHDAVRCLVSVDLIRRSFESALENGNAVPVIHVKDSVRILTDNGLELADRSRLRIIQTPQTFFSNSIKKAFSQSYDDSFTDEATVAERYGIKLHFIDGEDSNIKITSPADLKFAEFMMRK